MDRVEDDSWVREFDVSNPQKTQAGYTVYRVSSKVYPKGCPEGASEVIVFKRYSEIRSLYKDLKIIYETKSAEKKKFPRFAKGHYFDRFDESVLEERQKQALSLLLFAGNISFLFTSEPFVKFFEDGVDTSTNDASNDMQPWTPEVYFSEKQDSSDDETIYEINRDVSNNDLSLNVKKSGEEDDKTWLSKAMSLCSEGDDIETLASEAGNIDNNVNVTKLIPQDGEATKSENLPSRGSVDMLPTLLESDEEGDLEEEVFVEIYSPKNSNCSENNSPRNSHMFYQEDEAVSGTCFREESDFSSKQPLDSNSSSPIQDITDNHRQDVLGNEDIDVVNTRMKSLEALESENSETISTVSEDGFEKIVKKTEASSTESPEPARRKVGRTVSNISVSWIDPKKKDYLYQAAQIIQQALYCEANEMYEDAFNKYKICVGILLNGVQHDTDGKRREAVRRKTAQYLVKAEFLFNTYLKHDENDIKDWSVEPQNSPQIITDRTIVDRQFGHLTLASLNVIGVIGKNMLVQCKGLEGVYVVKVLHKTNAVHRSSRQENKQTNKSFSKKYVKSTRMVRLHRHFDTTDSIFLLIEYATGGNLWNHVKSFRQHYCKSQVTSGLPDENIAASDTSGTHHSTSGEHETLDTPEISSAGGNMTEGTLDNKEGNHILNSVEHSPTPAGTNSLSPSKEFSSFGNHQSDTTSGSEQETCLNQDVGIRSLKNKDSESGPGSSGGVLGFLDHVTKDYSGMDKCIQQWIAELLLAIDSIHSCGIILKDLKPSNVLLDENGHVKLSYFGVWEEVDHSIESEAVQQFYCAPEISRSGKITFSADWWTLGVLSYELITGKTLCSTHPWGIYPHSSIIFPSENISTEARSFLSGLICHNPRERLGSAMDGVEGIKSHAFFHGVDWNELAKSS